MSAEVVALIWICLTFGASVFIVTEAVNSVLDYLHQMNTRSDGNADAALILAFKAMFLSVAMLLFFAAGVLSYFLPPPTPPAEVPYRAQILQSLLILGQFFIFCDGVALFALRRYAKRAYIRERTRTDRLAATRDQLTLEIRENRRYFAEVCTRVEKTLTELSRKLDERR